MKMTFSKRFSRCTGEIQKKVRKAFTLIEVIMGISVSALIMFGCCALMFDMVSVLEFFENGWTLKSHVDGVEKFLRSNIMSSSFSDTAVSELGETLASNEAKTVYLAHDPESSISGDYFLAFQVSKAHPFYNSPFGFSPEKICFLELDSNGLWIVWRFLVSEDKDGDCAIYRSLVSEYVKEITYLYYDESRGWEEDTKIRTLTTSSTMPKYFKIIFASAEEQIERVIALDSFVDYQISK